MMGGWRRAKFKTINTFQFFVFEAYELDVQHYVYLDQSL